jgi:hypothetical protein
MTSACLGIGTEQLPWVNLDHSCVFERPAGKHASSGIRRKDGAKSTPQRRTLPFCAGIFPIRSTPLPGDRIAVQAHWGNSVSGATYRQAIVSNLITWLEFVFCILRDLVLVGPCRTFIQRLFAVPHSCGPACRAGWVISPGDRLKPELHAPAKIKTVPRPLDLIVRSTLC